VNALTINELSKEGERAGLLLVVVVVVVVSE
jgi:hypothetical protein